MSCYPVKVQDCLPCAQTPVPDAPPLPLCESSECPEVVNTDCVIYTKEPLPAIGVATNDSLTTIVQKWAQNVASGAIAVMIQDSNSVDLSGTGLSGSALKADLRVDPVVGNLIQLSVNGVKVVVTDQMIQAILDRIPQVEALKRKFCENVQACGDYACQIINTINIE